MLVRGSLAVGTLVVRVGARLAQHVVVAGRQCNGSGALLAPHALGGRLQVERLLYVVKIGARSSLQRLEGRQREVAPRAGGQRAGRVELAL